ncbi:MAG TPA: serine/threonine-protein kinase, partial [Anaerolineales bacterium]|nr:serine/threonine-protein kinase [Anaerolineales bacterium]
MAIKVIAPEHANHPDFIRMFEAEARLVAQLEHPHIVPLFDYWREPGGAYLVMRWLPHSLRSLLANGAFEPMAALPILEQIAAALATAHRHGVAHLDLKPDNILLDDDGNAYLADFGIARAVDSARGTGATSWTSEAYSAPEQIRHEPASARADLYSLGLLIYEMLFGQHPFVDTPPGEMSIRQLHEALPHVEHVPEGVNRVIQRATAKEPEARYADAQSLVAELRDALLGIERDVAAEASEPINPYKGLRPFEEADAADFFGRDALVRRLLGRLTPGEPLQRLLTIVGPSGCGKSSVMRAGLVPALRQGAVPGSDRWFIVLLTPGEHALRSLETALLSVASRPPAFLYEQLQTNGRGLLWAADAVLGKAEGDLLLLIDQFEELFTLETSEQERVQFLDLLCSAV